MQSGFGQNSLPVAVRFLLTLTFGVPGCAIATVKLTWKLWLFIVPAVWWVRTSNAGQSVAEDGGIRLDTILLGAGMFLTVLTFLLLFSVVMVRSMRQNV